MRYTCICITYITPTKMTTRGRFIGGRISLAYFVICVCVIDEDDGSCLGPSLNSCQLQRTIVSTYYEIDGKNGPPQCVYFESVSPH